jgi:mycolic acid cyclopropane synthetase
MRAIFAQRFFFQPGQYLGVHLVQHGNQVPRPYRHLGRYHATREPGRHACMAQVVGPASQRRPVFLRSQHCSGSYDAIVSVEMLEAVGSANWREYFQVVDRLLAEDGRFALQVITFPHQKMLTSHNDFGWVDCYIFPGGALPSLREIDRLLDTATSLEVTDARRLTDSYGRTLRDWRHRFAEQLTAVGEARFRRHLLPAVDPLLRLLRGQFPVQVLRRLAAGHAPPRVIAASPVRRPSRSSPPPRTGR